MDNILSRIAQELIAIRQNSRLSGELKCRGKALLTELKRQGYSAEQIEAMTQGLWKASTARAYTKGVSAENTSEPQELMQTLAEMFRLGITFEQVRQANSIKKIADGNNISIEQLSHAAATAGSANLNTVVAVVKEAEKKGIPLDVLPHSLSEIISLGRVGIDTKKITILYDLATKFVEGKFDEAVELIKNSKSVKDSRLELTKLRSEENAAKARINAYNSELKDLDVKISKEHGTIDHLSNLEAQGFDKTVLAKIEEASKRYDGPKGVLDAILKIDNIQGLDAHLAQIRNETLHEQSKRDKLRTDYGHLIFEISLCKEPLGLGYSSQAIQQIILMAKKHGPPASVMEILSQFDNVASIKATLKKAWQYDQMKQQLDNADKKIEELESLVIENVELKRQVSELRNKIEGSEKRWCQNAEEIIIQLRNPPEERKFPQELAGSDLPSLIEKIVEQEVSDRLTMAGNSALRSHFKEVMQKEVQKILTGWPSRELRKMTLENTRLVRQLCTEDPSLY